MNELPCRIEPNEGLTALITLDFTGRNRQLFERVQAQVVRLCAAGIAVLVAHHDRRGPWDQRLAKAAGRWPASARLLSHALVPGAPNNALLRNFGAKHIEGGHIALLDADIFPDAALLQEMYQSVLAGAEAFAMAPCLYLTPRGTRHVQRNRDPGLVFERFLQFDKTFVHHIASPSSVMVFAHKDFVRIGGFCEEYRGHGYEDFDFMIRLALEKQLITWSREFTLDHTYNAPLLAAGFRALLSPLCLDRLLDKKFALHLHHDKQSRDPYYSARQLNARLFQVRMEQLLEGRDLPLAGRSAQLRLTDAFFERCEQRGLDSSHYYALFDARPDYLARGGRSLRLIRRWFRRLPGVIRKSLRRPHS